MVDQASVRKAAPAGSQSNNGVGNGSVVGSLADLGNDVATLVELQAKLMAVDFKASASRAAVPMSAAAIGLATLVAALPVALLGVADLLARGVGIAAGWAMLIVALCAILMAGPIVYLSVREATRSLEPLRRSQEELVRNLSWLRTVLVYSGRSFSDRC